MGLNAAHATGPLRVGVVGLGVGTLAAYGKAGDTFRFYEINPLVVQIAKNTFTFLRDSEAKIEVVSGDARLALEREAIQEFDVLILDAFSSDAVPIHLLTDEAVSLYLKHLQFNGWSAFQVTNRLLDLASVVAKHAEKHKLYSALILQQRAEYSDVTPSAWLLMTRNASLFNDPKILESKVPISIDQRVPVWTDNYHNLFQILRANQR